VKYTLTFMVFSMKRIALLLMVAITTTVSAGNFSVPAEIAGAKIVSNSEIKIPRGYRDWRLISVAHEAGNLNDIRSILGNDVAIKAYRDNKLPFPDGTILARLAWAYVSSEENNEAFGREQSFVAGSPTNVQFMVKDSKKYAATGGWGFAQFTGGRPANEAVPNACFSCHTPAKARDFVFTHYAP
jgi:hypothetical protein